MKAIQDYYDGAHSHCYGCGRNNPHGHQLKTYWNSHGTGTIAHFTPASYYTGGVPDHVYGGMIASLIDCHGAATAAAYACKEAGIDIETPDAPIRFVTASLQVSYLKPTPIDVELELRGKLKSIDGRKVWVDLEFAAGDTVCATGEMLAIRLRD